ncbi:MAG: endonuclease/exonuclease/phosphatase family protein [Gemmataceae bacterium]
MARSNRQPTLLGVLLLIGILAAIAAWQNRDKLFGPKPEDAPNGTAAGPGEYLFCLWNVENLFDDQLDHRRAPDEEYDKWFADNAADRELKYKHLSEALLRMNGGKGPDIIALVEVETVRAAELLRVELNKGLPAGATPYFDEPLMQEVAAGRHIAPAILTRVRAIANRTKGFGTSRILEAHFKVNDHDLVVLASHWTSQLTDKSGEHREKYANQIYGRANAMYKSNPKVDVLVCGDFNDVPESPAVVHHLHAGSDRQQVAAAVDQLVFLDLLAGKEPKQFGTHFYGGKPLIYDHICVSPGMLDNSGWSCDPDSVQTVTDGLIRPGSTKRQPWRFGNHKDDGNRGYSDHFPVTVKLKVN